MVKWMAKAAVQGTISALPKREIINHWFQMNVTRSLPTEGMEAIEVRTQWAGVHLEKWRTHTDSKALPRMCLDLGTGWFPKVPIAFYLCGVDCTITVDINDLFREDYMRKLFKVYAELTFDELCEVLPCAREDRLRALQALVAQQDTMPIDGLLCELGIKRVLGDAAAIDLPDGQIDLIVSNTTLEHIPYDVIEAIFTNFRRLIAPNGIMSHLTDISDHYCHFDAAITPYNYLRYSDKMWRFFNNALLYQNRLRVPDYRRAHEQTGFEIVEETTNTDHADDLRGLSLARQFRHYTWEELTPTQVWHVAAPA